MAKKLATRRVLLDRWRGIEEEDDDGIWSDPSKRSRHQRLKEDWFSDAFNLLISFPKDTHIWCGSFDIMGPLLETFYNYFKADHQGSPLKILWRRISGEMRQCMQCISQHHQALEMYSREYDLKSIGPLLDVMQSLDEERVTQHLKEINARISKDEYDPIGDSTEAVTVMFEVLMFPVLLDDQSLDNEFQRFLESIDNKHELALAGRQQYPGVYALFFSNSRRVRSIGHRLAGCMGKLRQAADLEPLQSLLKKCISFFMAEVLPTVSETSRPRVQLERTTVWLGIKALLGLLEPAALEEGILEHHPVFLSIVLNHVSDDTPEFSHAVVCLKLLFEILGYKLWLRCSLSPSVMRNTLLGQCFHSRNEKSHKEIFDLFQPFLQSLEALQDGEHEEQRRNFLYFLLHQVTVSSNFSILMKRKARQIALLIISRGYKMNPPCPPFKYSHMWGPSLVSSLKDSSLHSSLRQPAFELIESIIVSDAAALISSLLNIHNSSDAEGNISVCWNDDDDDDNGLPFSCNIELEDTNPWGRFSAQEKIISHEYDAWMCIPRLWLDVLVEIDPMILPISFSKAVFWARSIFSLVEPENSTEMTVPVKDWMFSCATEISPSFKWKVSTGCDDGEGKESGNSVKVSKLLLPLIRAFKRFTAHFLVQMEQGVLWKQWTWEPRMGESLILLLLDSNDNTRQVGRRVLEQVSNMRSLSNCLQFLCSSESSLSAVLCGLKHAFKLVELDSVLLNFHTLHNFFFVLCKLLKEGVFSISSKLENQCDDAKLSSQGGFLKQPVFSSLYAMDTCHSSSIDTKSVEKFCCLVSEIAWPCMRKCLVGGKSFIDYKISQMACIRLLEFLPVVFERLSASYCKLSKNSREVVKNVYDFKWLLDLMDWGKSPLDVIIRYWKQCVISVVSMLEGSLKDKSPFTTGIIKKFLSCDNIPMDDLVEEISRFSVSLSNEVQRDAGKTKFKSKALFQGAVPSGGSCSRSDMHFLAYGDADLQILDSVVVDDQKDKNDVIVLSDDETEKHVSFNRVITSENESSGYFMDKTDTAPVGKLVSLDAPAENEPSDIDIPKKLSSFTGGDSADGLMQKLAYMSENEQQRMTALKLRGLKVKKEEKSSEGNVCNSLWSNERAKLNDQPEETVKSKNISQENSKVAQENSEKNIRELASDAVTVDDLLELKLKPTIVHETYLAQPSKSAPKRQVVQLSLPGEDRFGFPHKPQMGIKRLMPPRLDDWYRPILELDFFATVGLASPSEDENQIFSKLKEVPVCFESPEEYVTIFQPLVLEEFKAELQSSYLDMPSREEACCRHLSVLSIERIDDFHLVRFIHDDTDSAASGIFSENDLVLLTKQPLQNSFLDVHVIGKVERREKDIKRGSSIITVRLYFRNSSLRLNRVRKLLMPRSKWFVSHLMSLAPQLREFRALSSLKDIPIHKAILKPAYHSVGNNASREVDLRNLPQPLQKMLKSSFNGSQLHSIDISVGVGSSGSKDFYELSLIQGPPGTGKTRTIVAIVSALLAAPVHGITDHRKSSGVSLRPSITSSTNSNLRISQSAAIAKAWQDAALARQLNQEGDNNLKYVESRVRGRVLICAQSNAAVDELVSRISGEGLYGSDGKMYKPYLVRVGNAKTVHPNSLPFFIDALVDQRMVEERINAGDVKSDLNGENLRVLRSNLEKLLECIRLYEAKRANLRDGYTSKTSFEDDDKDMSDVEIGVKLRKLYDQKKEIYKELAIAQSRQKKANEEIRSLKHRLRKSILREAEIVVTTLNGSGGDLHGVCSESVSSHKFFHSSENTLFDAVVIDEAAQALEPATLIPLQLLKSNGTKCIMVGDPKQLPATVLSTVASKYLYQCSMFERLQRAGHPVIMLNEQYRMHPEICRFPSLHFYNGKLLNGKQMSCKSAPYHESKVLGPYVFFDVIDGKEIHGKKSSAMSLYNECEADAAVAIVRYFRNRYPSQFWGGRLGIITPYKCQLSLLRSRFTSAFGSSITADVEFNTVDGFQGREVDILILSTVRAATSLLALQVNSNPIGFVADVRRMNVALTRAKLSLWIMGNANTLQTNRNWDALIGDARRRNLLVSIKKPYETMFNAEFGQNLDLEKIENQPRELEQEEKVTYAKEAVDRNVFGKGDFSSGKHQGRTRRARDRPDFPKMDVLSPRDSGTPIDKKEAAIRENVTFGERKSEEPTSKQSKKHLDEEKVTSKTEDIHAKSVEEIGDKHKIVVSEARRRTVQPSEQSSSEKKMKLGTSKWGDNLKEKDGVDGCPTSKKVDMSDLVKKRKCQREAVDALLSSALISSKISETSCKSVVSNKPSSTLLRSSGIRPPKPRKAQPASSSKEIADETYQRPFKREKSLGSKKLA